MNDGGKYFAMAAEEGPAAGKAVQEVSTKPPWWSGVVLDSILGFSATLVFVLGGILMLRRWRRQRHEPK